MRTAGTILPAFEELFFDDEFTAVGVGVDDSVEEAADAVTKQMGRRGSENYQHSVAKNVRSITRNSQGSLRTLASKIRTIYGVSGRGTNTRGVSGSPGESGSMSMSSANRTQDAGVPLSVGVPRFHTCGSNSRPTWRAFGGSAKRLSACKDCQTNMTPRR